MVLQHSMQDLSPMYCCQSCQHSYNGVDLWMFMDKGKNIPVDLHIQLRKFNLGSNRSDVVANGFWGSPFERAFRVFNPFAPSNRHFCFLSPSRKPKKEAAYKRSGALVFYPPGLRHHRWPWPSSHSLLQTPCQHALGQIEATIGSRSSKSSLNGHLAASVDLTIAESNLSVWTLNSELSTLPYSYYYISASVTHNIQHKFTCQKKKSKNQRQPFKGLVEQLENVDIK